MKKLIFIFMLTLTLSAADFTNDGATITIGEGVTLRADGDFENNGTLFNNGTFATSGQFSGENSLSGTNVTYFGTAVVNGDIDYSTLSIEGTNSLSDDISVNDLAISGDFDLSGQMVEIMGGFSRDGGDISGEGFLRVHKEEEFTGDLDLSHLGFMVRYDGMVDIAINRYAGMVDHNDRLSLNTYFEVNLNLEDASQDLLGIGIALEEQDLNGMDLEKLSIFRADASDLSAWTPIGGVIENGYIMLDDIPNELFQDDNNLSLDGYYTVGEVGCVDDMAANYDVMAFGGEYTCNYDFSEEFSEGIILKSFYSIDDEDNSITNVLSSLDQAIEIIGEGEASSLHPVLDWIGSVTEIDRRKGYWIRMFSDDVYEHLNGKADTTTMEYSIHEGANLISYSGPQETLPIVAMPEGSSCTQIIGQGEATTYSPALDWIGSLTHLKPWGGYWVICSDDETLVWEGHGALPRLDIEEYSVPEEFAFEQSTQQAFYFIEQIEDAVIGRDIIIAKKGDDIVGSVVYSGDYTTVPVMGKWEDVPGYSPNEVVTLQLYNPDLDAYYYLRGQELQSFENLGIDMVGPMTQLPVIPENFVLHSAYPNPFNPSTNIRFDLPSQLKVKLEVYNITGQLVKTLKDSNMEPGYYEVSWDASSVASGAYFVKLSAGNRVNTQKIMLIK